MQWSDCSINLFNAVADTSDNIQVSACPGSGKTTNCKEIWQRYPDQSIAYLVFNKANAVEAQAKIPLKGSQSYIGTMHSLGMKAINKVLADKKPTIDTQGKKVRKLIWDNYPFDNDRLKSIKQGDIYKLVSLMKGAATAEYDDVKGLCELHDIPDSHEIILASQDVYNRSLSNHAVIDFDDMLLFPVVHNRYKEALPRFNLVLGDEGQDFNAVQLALLGSIAERLVVVGDERQAIYGFRGALSDSLEQVRSIYQAVRLPLNLTYRCPKTIVAAAQAYYPDDIHALPEADTGIVRSVTETAWLAEDYRSVKDSLVVCRNMAPLVQHAYALLRKKVPVRLRGRDIGQNLIKFIRRFQEENINTLLQALEAWADDEAATSRQKGNESKLQSIEDKVETIHAFVAMCDGTSVQELCDAIDALFTADYGLELSTIHRAKGLEATRVYWLLPELLPSVYAKQAWQQQQEANLAYVAITRSKHELVYLTR